MAKRNVIIFGTGMGGKRTSSVLPYSDHLVAFSDNDSSKHGQLFEGHPVIAPQEIIAHEVDGVIIASSYWKEISQQLRELGLPPEKIELVEPAILIGTKAIHYDRIVKYALLSVLVLYGFISLSFDIVTRLF